MTAPQPDREGPQLDLSELIRELRDSAGTIPKATPPRPSLTPDPSTDSPPAPASISWPLAIIVYLGLAVTAGWILAAFWRVGWLPSPTDLRAAGWDVWHLIVLLQFLATLTGLALNQFCLGARPPIPANGLPTLAIVSLVLPGLICLGVWTIVLLNWQRVGGDRSASRSMRLPTLEQLQQLPNRWWLAIGLGELICLWLLLTRVGLPDAAIASVEVGWSATATLWHARLSSALAVVGLIQVLLAGFAIIGTAAEQGDSQWVGGLVGSLVPLVGFSPLAAHLAILEGLDQVPQFSPLTGVVVGLGAIWGALGLFGVWYVLSHWQVTRDAALLACLGYFLLIPYFALEIEQLRRQAAVPQTTPSTVDEGTTAPRGLKEHARDVLQEADGTSR